MRNPDMAIPFLVLLVLVIAGLACGLIAGFTQS